MNRDEIREGDNVNVYFENVPWLKNLRVNHIPCATGDCWHLENTETHQVYYVMLFAYMELVK